MAAAAHGDDGGIAEKSRHAFDVQGRRGHDHLEIRAARQQPLEHAHQQIDIQRALVRLVDDDGVVAPQAMGRRRVPPTASRRSSAPGEWHRTPDRRIARENRRCGRAAAPTSSAIRAAKARAASRRGWVCAIAAVDAASQLQAILGQLRALAGAGVAGDDQYLVAAQASMMASRRAEIGRSASCLNTSLAAARAAAPGRCSLATLDF